VAYAMPKSRPIINWYDVEAAVDQLELRRTWLEEAVRQAELTRRFTGPLEFPGAPAYKAASRGLEVLREITVQEASWHPGNFLGIPVTFNNAETIAITVTEGDELTGLVGDEDPKTRALKGPNTARASDSNRLFEDPPVSFWYLLIYSGEELRAELSCPTVEEDGVVRGWGDRIILGDVEPPAERRRVKDAPPPNDAPEVIVRRKTA
jgi:hypothetical protein